MPETVAATPYGNWNQALGTLGASLFPDPSKIAQAGYYGAEQRKAALQGNQAIDEMNARNAGLSLTPGSGIPYSSPQFYTPQGSPPGAPPVMAPPANLPMQGAPPAQGSSPPAQPSLSAIVAPGPGQSPPPATIPPAQLADVMTQGNNPNPGGVGTAGTPPVQSSPAPNSGAPPAPNTTGSDGSVPANDASSATIHPGSLQAQGGGIKQAPPAQANGSPAPLAFNPALYTAMMTRAGYNADQVRTMGAAYVMQAVRQGIIDEPTGKQLLAGFGMTGPLQAQTELQREAMSQAGQTQRQGMATGEQRYEFQQTPTMVTDQPGGAPHYVPRVNAPGQLAYDAPYSTQYNTPTLVQPSGPAAPPVYMKAGAIPPGTPGYNAQFSTDYTTPQTVGGPQGQPVVIRRGELPTGGAAGYSTEQEKAHLDMVPVFDEHGSWTTVSRADYAKGGYTPAPPSLDIPAAEVGVTQNAVDNAGQRIYPAPSVPVGGKSYPQPVRAYGEGNARLLALTRQLQLTSRDPAIRGNPNGAATAAWLQGIQEGWLPKPAQTAAERAHFAVGQETLMRSHIFTAQNPTGTATAEFYRLDDPRGLGSTVTTPPAGNQQPPPNQGAPVAGTPPAFTDYGTYLTPGSARPPPAAAAPARTPTPPGAIGPAPPGATEGSPVVSSSGRSGVVHGGFIYPAQTAGAAAGRG